MDAVNSRSAAGGRRRRRRPAAARGFYGGFSKEKNHTLPVRSSLQVLATGPYFASDAVRRVRVDHGGRVHAARAVVSPHRRRAPGSGLASQPPARGAEGLRRSGRRQVLSRPRPRCVAFACLQGPDRRHAGARCCRSIGPRAPQMVPCTTRDLLTSADGKFER